MVHDRSVVPGRPGSNGGPTSALTAPSQRLDGQKTESNLERIRQFTRECRLTATETTRLAENPELLAAVCEIWDKLSVQESIASRKKGNAIERINKERQSKGRYEVWPPGQKLPDPDPRTGEYLSYQHEPNPAGGPDLVRIIRIYPGEDKEFDEGRQQEDLARITRRDSISQLINSYVK